jgi:hypothetical protein
MTGTYTLTDCYLCGTLVLSFVGYKRSATLARCTKGHVFRLEYRYTTGTL